VHKLKTVIFSLLIFHFYVLISLKFVSVCKNFDLSNFQSVDSEINALISLKQLRMQKS